MMNLIKNHKWALILAFVTAIIVAYPQIYLRYDLGDNYQGIEFIGAGDDEASWMSRLREVQDGYNAFSCTYLKDGKNDPYSVQPLGTIFFASPGNLFSLNPNDTLLFSRLFFSFVLFFIVYIFLYLFSGEKLIALASTTLFLLGRDLLSRGGFQELILIGTPSTKYLNLMRPVNPLMTYFFFFGFLLFFWLFYTKKQWRWGILSILMLGLSFYDYFFTWTFLYAFCGLLIAVFLLRRKWQDARRIGLVLLGSAIMAIPYALNMYRVISHPNYAEVSQRFGLLSSHAPSVGILYLLLFGAVLLFFPRSLKERYFFAVVLSAVPFFVLNQQVITGKTLSEVHYHWYYTWPLVIIFLSMILLFGLAKIKWRLLKTWPALLIILASIFSGVLVQGASYAISKQAIAEYQKYGQVMNWLDRNAQKEEVVFANDETSSLIVVYTPLNVFYHFKAQTCFAASRERLLQSLFLYYRLDGVNRERAEEFFLKNKGDISHFMYGMYYDFATGDYSGMPDEILADFTEKYRDSFSFSDAEFMNNLFRRYEVKYAVWDKKANPSWQMDKYPFLEKAAEFNNFVIYRYAD